MSIWTQNIGREMLVTELPVIAILSSLMHGERFLLLSDEAAVVDSLSGQVQRNLFSSSEAIQKIVKFVPADESGVLPFKSQFFDGIIIHHDLEKKGDPRQGLREAVRVLKPGGKLLLVGFIPAIFLFTNLFSVKETNLKFLFFFEDLMSCCPILPKHPVIAKLIFFIFIF